MNYHVQQLSHQMAENPHLQETVVIVQSNTRSISSLTKVAVETKAIFVSLQMYCMPCAIATCYGSKVVHVKFNRTFHLALAVEVPLGLQ